MDRIHSEYLTRKIKIDKILELSGWKVVDFSPKSSKSEYANCAVREYPTANGPVDYALFDDGQPIAVVEAKKEALSAYNVMEQAHRYARGLETGLKFGEYGVPFAYSSNGNEIFFQDLRDPKSYSRKVARFHTPDGLREWFSEKRREGLAWLKKNRRLISGTRPYQEEAIFAAEAALAENERRMLLAMATGTGKTFTSAQLIYRLMKSGYGRRILFLVDRRALAAQAVREFSTFEPEPGQKLDKLYEVYSQRFRKEDFEDKKFNPSVLPTNYLTEPKRGQAFVYVCTIQRMRINLFGKEGMFEEADPDQEEDANKINIPIHAFDVVIADECHRGYTSQEESKWREVLEYFDAVKIGLTATPASHTMGFFEKLIFRYEYERAVEEGYLVDYDRVAIHSAVRLKGIFLRENERINIIDTETGMEKLDVIEDEREYESTKVEREITSPDSTEKILREFAQYAVSQEKATSRFPKTLIFAVNDLPHVSHADRVLMACRKIFGRGDSFVQKITGSPTVDRPLQQIRKFRNRPEPGIVVTVDMLSTGVDIPSLENIIFLRPVKSRILFAQMLGRGTRKCDEIGKDHFTVFDCFGGSLLEYFSKATDLTLEAPDKPSRTIKEIIDAIYSNKDRRYNIGCLVKRLQRIAKNMSGDALEEFASYVPGGDIGSFAAGLPAALETDFAGTIHILMDEGFQNVLLTYPRKVKSFVVATESKDEVSSVYMFKTAEGKDVKCEDYIHAFETFVRENPEKIQAIKIILEKPSGWNTEALSEIKSKLRRNPNRFTLENLRKAYHSDLADIISIIKHAARDEPLQSAEERVDRAMKRVMKGKKFTEPQKKWLERIRDHLKENLAIEKKDFETIPILARPGGWKRADKEFNGEIAPLLRRINEEVAK